MSSDKSKSDLVAIYRLEFYKKQKNWKLTTNALKKNEIKKNSSDSKSLLNETYSIKSEHVGEENPDTLNVAFWEPESEIVSPKNSNINSSKLTQQWLEPVNIWPKITRSDPTTNFRSHLSAHAHNNELQSQKSESGWIQKRMEVLLKAAEERGYDVQSDTDLKKRPICKKPTENFVLNQQDQHWDKFEEYGVPENTQSSITPQPWIRIKDFESDIFGNDRDLIDELETLPQWEDSCFKLPWVPDAMEGERSIDSIGDFIRGAHAAPHSSEMDLALPPELRPAEVTSETLCLLSSRQLKEALSQHRLLLTRLLKEQERRKNVRVSVSLGGVGDMSSFEEYPTRDIGLSIPWRTKLYNDDVIAGSHRDLSSRGLGRGRGRLHSNQSGVSFERRAF